jgi:hypothetical protein
LGPDLRQVEDGYGGIVGVKDVSAFACFSDFLSDLLLGLLFCLLCMEWRREEKMLDCHGDIRNGSLCVSPIGIQSNLVGSEIIHVKIRPQLAEDGQDQDNVSMYPCVDATM